MSNLEKTVLLVIGLLIIVSLVFGVIIFRQQKAINSLTGKSGAAAVQTPAKKSSPPLSEVIRQFAGTVENISANQLMVSVKLPDFSKPKNQDKLKNTDSPQNLSAADFETLDKKIMVNTNEKTVFEKKKLADLKAGDMVSITSDKSPYSSSVVTAEKITFIGSPK